MILGYDNNNLVIVVKKQNTVYVKLNQKSHHTQYTDDIRTNSIQHLRENHKSNQKTSQIESRK